MRLDKSNNYTTIIPARTKGSSDVRLMLSHRLRCWPNIARITVCCHYPGREVKLPFQAPMTDSVGHSSRATALCCRAGADDGYKDPMLRLLQQLE